jgi:antitoxin ParD1/3/4
MDMTSLNISLPESLKTFAEEQATAGGYTSVSEYLRELLRADQRRKAKARLEALLLEGLNSGEPIEVTPRFWDDLRRDLHRRLATKTAA